MKRTEGQRKHKLFEKAFQIEIGSQNLTILCVLLSKAHPASLDSNGRSEDDSNGTYTGLERGQSGLERGQSGLEQGWTGLEQAVWGWKHTLVAVHYYNSGLQPVPGPVWCAAKLALTARLFL